MSNQFSGTLETGSPNKSYAQYKINRKEQLDQITNDIQVHQEREIQSLQETLRNLMTEFDLLNGKMATEEREFIKKKETLYSELKKTQIQADIDYSKLRIDQINEIDNMKHDFNSWLQEFNQIIPTVLKNCKPIEFSQQKFISPSKSNVKSINQNKDENLFEISTINDLNDANEEVFNKRIEELEEQKAELLYSIRDIESENEKSLNQLYIMIDSQENSFQRQLAQLQSKIQAKEEQYESQLNKLYGNLDKLKEKRKAISAKRNAKINQLQSHINELESESNMRIQEAGKQAERLKNSLINSNLIKEQNLEVERKRNEQTLQLHQESLALQQQLFVTKRELQKEKIEAQQWRNECARQMGPRRTMTMFS